MPEEAIDIQEQIRVAVKAMFANPAVAARVCDLANNKRPAGTSRHSSYPYYKEAYALQLKKAIDQQIISKQAIILRYADAEAEGKSANSVYMMANQALRYLFDFLDTDGTYANWRKVANITRDKKRGGVCFDLIKEARGEPSEFNCELIVPKESTTPKWRIAMDEWLESSSDRPFIQEGLTLTLAEVAELRQQLGQLQNVIADVSVRKVSIVKTR